MKRKLKPFVFDEQSQKRDDHPCFCPCHVYPGAYPTNPEKPCIVCGHVDDDGHLRGTDREGWIKEYFGPQRIEDNRQQTVDELQNQVKRLEAVLDLIIGYEDVPIVTKANLIELVKKGKDHAKPEH